MDASIQRDHDTDTTVDPDVIVLMRVIRSTLLFVVRWIEKKYGIKE